MNDRGSAPVGVGVISILTVLLVLALTLFSALTLTSARADMALSQRNADTVAAWYAADSQAVRLYQEFAAGTDAELTEQLTVTQGQMLELHLIRAADGTPQILCWRAAPESSSYEFDDSMDVWDGTLPD